MERDDKDDERCSRSRSKSIICSMGRGPRRLRTPERHPTRPSRIDSVDHRHHYLRTSVRTRSRSPVRVSCSMESDKLATVPIPRQSRSRREETVIRHTRSRSRSRSRSYHRKIREKEEEYQVQRQRLAVLESQLERERKLRYEREEHRRSQKGSNEELHDKTRRWCVSYVWSAATVLLHRLMTSQLALITASSKPALPGRAPPRPSRPASSGHIHPEPLVCCQLLHEPPAPEQDVIFVHGLYGSLENTWRQGDWRSKYKLEPNKVPLKRSASIPSPCVCHECNNDKAGNLETSWKDVTYTKTEFYNKRMEKVIGNDDLLMTEQFYNNTLMNQVKIVDNFEMQAQFVRELFECEDMNEMYNQRSKEGRSAESPSKEKVYQCECNECRDENEKVCPTGCGCVCDRCYSPCWPRDWLRVDFPNARVISINYTSDPYLWRPLWVKESKRLRLHERAEQMTKQLLDLGVGERPIVWVGHSKGGLFIKQIYCEAYEAFLKTKEGEKGDQNETNQDNNNETKNNIEKLRNQNGAQDGGEIPNLENNRQQSETNINPKEGIITNVENGKQYSETNRNQNVTQEKRDNIHNLENNRQHFETNINQDGANITKLENDRQHSETNIIQDGAQEKGANIPELETENSHQHPESNSSKDPTDEAEKYNFKERSSLWSKSTGFMFYSVPHRGSALADIKTPITARSIELLEISKDNTLVLSLQQRWLRATEPSKPVVRSLVETNRTLMAVLWLRIVSVESADAGIGALCGISVDHREICKPSSRSCILYTELLNLIHAALDRWRWNTL